MTKNLSEEYMARIANATPLQLVVIIYELAVGFIETAIASKPQSSELETAIGKARAAVSELFSSLDMDITQPAEDLANLLLYVNRLLIRAGFKRNNAEKNALLNDAREILKGLLEAWQELDADDTLAEKIFENAPQVFAGLTYSKDGQLAEFTDENPDRGYKI